MPPPSVRDTALAVDKLHSRRWDATTAGSTLSHPHCPGWTSTCGFPPFSQLEKQTSEIRGGELLRKQKSAGISRGQGESCNHQRSQWVESTRRRGAQGRPHRQESAAAGKRRRDRLPCDWLRAASLAALLLP